MRRNRLATRTRRGGDAELLAKMARRLSESGSRIEDRIWERRLVEVLNDRLARGFDDVIEAALDELSKTGSRAYDDLADLAESCAEAVQVAVEGETRDVLMIALPLLAWSRYALPTGALNAAVVDNIRTQIGGHLAARGARVSVANTLLSLDQLPESLGEVRDFSDRLAGAAAAGTNLSLDPKSLREPVAMLADTRYLLAAIAVPESTPIFHWQDAGVDPDAKLTAVVAFSEQLAGVLAPTMTGCRYRVLPPQAFHAGLRQADRDLREFSLEAAITFLGLTFNIEPAQLQANMALFEDKREAAGAEIRIGIGRSAEEETVIEGVVWPLLGDDAERAFEEIESALKRQGLTRVVTHEHAFPMEYCDDCGAPLFPNAAGQPVHAEPPEDTEEQPAVPLH